MATIHPSAIVGSDVELAGDVEVGPYCILSGRIRIGAGSVIKAHSVLEGTLRMGEGCVVGPGAYVGLAPQHLKYRGEPTLCVIGDRVVIRETATVHRSFHPGEEHATRIGDRCFLMAASHVGHDTVLGNDVTMANASMCGGHVSVGDNAFLGGGCIFHQFVRVGRLAIVAGNEGLNRDIPPFAAVRFDGLKAYNAIGLRRAGLGQPAIHAIRQAYQRIHTHRNMERALAAIRGEVEQTKEVVELLEFIETGKRGILPSYRFVKGGVGED
ncbi:MAG TPA: acyl-ACP--UDP-N-acetylglucosamine O-acyltransferase [Tepidisphaeraceae bacterium]|nr:acyl-ACP--UDP-N-acetylglucosamine O-acyltransferase [Tepidisphaeraceae bacterium]